MTDARSRTPQEYVRSTWRRWGRNRRLLVAVIGALVVLAMGSISAAALVGLPTILTSDTNATGPTSNGNATGNTNSGGSQAIPNAQDFALGASGGATLSAAGQGSDPVEGESFTHPNGTEVVLGNQYSGGKALKITSGQALPTRKVTITDTPSHVLVRARAGQSGGSPTLTIRVDGNNAGTRRITSSVLSDYLYAGITLQPGTYTLGLKGGDLAQGRYVFVDVLRFPAVNKPPVGADDSATVGEDFAATTIDVLANDTDPDGDTLTVTANTSPAHGTLSRSGGTFTYTPQANFNGTDSFTYTISDGKGGTATAKVNVTVGPDNDAPTAQNATASMAEDAAPITIDFGALASDIETADANLAYDVGIATADTGKGSLGSVAGDPTKRTFDSAENFNGPVTINYQVTDRGDPDNCGPAGPNCALAKSASGTVTVNVTPVNDAPSFTAGPNQTAPEDSGAQSGPWATAISQGPGESGQQLTFEVTNNTNPALFSSGPSVSATNGALSYTPAADKNGSATITLRLKDDGGTPGNPSDDATSAPQTFIITVSPVNDAPTAQNATRTVPEDGSLPIDFGTLVSDLETPNANLSISASIAAADVGKGDLSGAGATRTFTPAPNFNGTVTIDYSVEDRGDPDNCGPAGPNCALAKSASGTVTVTVTPVNDDPTAVDDTKSTDEDTTLSFPSDDLVGNDTDVEGDSLSVSSVGSASHGTTNLANDGTVTYTPEADYNGSDSFEYTVSDGNGGTATAKVNVTVNPVNDAPVANDDSASVAEGGTITDNVLPNDKDVEGDTLNAVLVSGPEHASSFALHADGSFEYVHDGSETTSDSFTYKANDGKADSNVATVTITIAPENDAPVANDDSFDVDEDQPLSVAALGGVLPNDTDAENDPLTAALVTGPAHAKSFTLHPDGSFDYEPEADFNGTDSFTYRASDGRADSNVATATITVAPINDAPSFDLGADQTVVNTAGAQTVSGFATNISAGPPDEDGQTLTFSVTNSDNSLFSEQPDIDETSGDLTYTPAENASGTATVTVVLKDNGGTAKGGEDTSVEKTLQITVKLPNAPPSAANQSVSADEDVAKTITLEADDPDGDAVTKFEISERPVNGSLGPIGSITCDGQTPNHCTADVSYTGNKDYNGPDQFKFTASDAQATGQPATVSITVNPVDDPPVAVDDSKSVAEDSGATPIDVLANDTDPDGGTKTIASVTQPANGTVAITNNGNDLTYKPNANYCNGGSPTDDFTYTLNGGSTATVAVTVTCVDDNPVAVNDSATKAEDSGATAIDVLANDTDVDGGSKTIGSVTQPTNGTVVITNGGSGLTYEPNANYCNDPPGTSPDTFTYTLSPGGSSATVSVKVTCVDDAPVAVNDSATVLEDAAATSVPVLPNDTDIDGGPKTVGSVTQPTNGTVAITGGGAGLTYKPNANYCNDPPTTTLDTFTYTLSPGGSQATVSMKVTCVNDAPTAGPETFSGAIHNTSFVVDDPSDAAPNVGGAKKTITGDVLSNDSDIETPGSVSVVANTNITSTNGGKVSIESDGDFTYVSNPNDNCSRNSDTFTYTVTDNDPAGAQTAQGTVTINLSGCVWYVDNDPATAGNAGTSSAPFDALSSADAKSVANQTVFVHKGTGNYTGGYTLDANERLIGAASNLVVGSDTLLTGAPANRPQLSGTVNLNSGNTVSGLAIAGSGTPAIAGGSGDNSGTIADVSLTGNAGGLKITGGASGTWNVSDLTVNTTGGDGVDVEDAGTLNLQGAGTISVTAAGGRGLVLADNAGTTGGMALSGTVDSTTVTSSPTTGIFLRGTTGSLTLDDVNLTTTGAGLDVDSSNGITVNNSGDADITSAGTAVSLTTATSNPANMPVVALDQVSSTGGTTGINIDDIGGGTFSANGGTLSGHTGAEVDVNNGSGNVTYPGTIGNGSGLSAQITGRTGGTIALSGNINDTNDAGGGIDMAGNTGGTTTFSGATKTLNTGTGPAFTSTGSNPTIGFTNGGLDIDTTSGAGFGATGGGTVTVGTGANPNTIDSTTTGTALNVSNTTIGASGLNFQRISAGNNTPATSDNPANGIVLSSTGSQGGLTVTGNGGTCTSAATCTGGAIQSSTGAGINLTNVGGGVSLTRMSVNNGGDDGIRGSSVNGLTIANSVILSNGNAVGERGIDMFDLTGSGGIASSTISASSETNVRIENNTATALSAFNVTGSTISSTSTVTGDDGILVLNDGAGAMTVSVTGSTFTNNKGDHFQAASDADASGSMNITFDNNTLDTTLNGPSGGSPVVIGGGITINTSGTLDINFHVGNNTIQHAFDDAINLNLDPGSQSGANFIGTITGNTIGTPGVLDSGSESSNTITMGAKGAGTATVAITNNNVRQFSNAYGIFVGATEGSPVVNATVTGNTVKEPGTFALNGIRVDVGATAGPPPDASTPCVNLTGNDATGSAKAPPSDTDIRLRQRFSTTIRLPGYSGGNSDTTAVNNFVAANNDPAGATLAPTVSSVVNTPPGGGFVNTTNGAACTLPTN